GVAHREDARGLLAEACQLTRALCLPSDSTRQVLDVHGERNRSARRVERRLSPGLAPGRCASAPGSFELCGDLGTSLFTASGAVARGSGSRWLLLDRLHR